MKPPSLRTLALVVLLAWGCSQESARQPARISGTHTLALAGKGYDGAALELVFVTSTDRSELRVIDIREGDFVRAPNPLEPLSIPVIDSPDVLSRDLGWADGDELVGNHVYAWSRGGTELSVVGAARASLRETGRLLVGQPITAVAARAGATSAAPSTLYVAVSQSDETGSKGVLRRAIVPAPGGGEAPRLDGSPVLVTSGVIVALAVLPTPGELIVSTRDAAGGGDVLWLDTAAPQAAVSLIAPPGERAACDQLRSPWVARVGALTRGDCGFSAPVRQLRVDPTGAPRVFGLLDESTCDDQRCSGIEAVELATGSEGVRLARIARDELGLPMAKVSSTGGLITSFDLSVNGQIAAPTGSAPFPTQSPLMGLTTEANGSIVYFDAASLRMPDLNGSGPTFELSSSAQDGAPLSGGPTDVELADGAAITEEVGVVREGPLPGRYPVSPFQLPAALAGIVEASDVAVVTGAGCQGEVAVVAGGGGLALAGPSPCPDGTFVVHAGPGSAHPFTVTGGATGFMGRVAAGETFTFPQSTDPVVRQARFFHHTEDATAQPVKPQLSFRLPSADPRMQRGDRYVLTVDAQFEPLLVPVNTNTFTGINLANHHLPTTVVRSAASNRTFVSYPSANSVLEINLATWDGSRASFEILPPYQ